MSSEADSTTEAPAPPTASEPASDLLLEAGSACSVELEVFEGPLDLLLHLVRRHELEILDIPISFVTEKYLEYLAFMRALDLEIAGDYLVMAATLAYLKSRELLPREEEEEEALEEEGPDPREELIRRLLEYQTFRDAAARMDQLPMAGRDTFGRGNEVELPPFDPGLAPITLFRLAEAFTRVLDRARISKSHDVVLERVSVSDRMQQLTLLLADRESFSLESLFLEQEWNSEVELRAMLVVTLMSLLEMVKLGVARVHQPHGSDTIHLERAIEADEAMQAISNYDEQASFGQPPGADASEPESHD